MPKQMELIINQNIVSSKKAFRKIILKKKILLQFKMIPVDQ